MAFALPLRGTNRHQLPLYPPQSTSGSQLLAHIEPLGQELDKTQLDNHISVRSVLTTKEGLAPSSPKMEGY